MSLNMVFAPGIPTFTSGSVIDVALVSGRAERGVEKFEVVCDSNLIGEHRPIVVHFKRNKIDAVTHQNAERTGWNLQGVDWLKFARMASAELSTNPRSSAISMSCVGVGQTRCLR